jgi:hypothetical protein
MSKFTLKEYIENEYNNDDTCVGAVENLTDAAWLEEMGWKQVFHEGLGDGVYSPKENLVVIFDVDDVPYYHDFEFYKYNEKAWKSCDDWDAIYDGDNGEDVEVERVY